MENNTNNTEAPEGLSQNEPTNIESSWGDMQIAPDSSELTQEWLSNLGVVSEFMNQESQSSSEREQINNMIISIETEWWVPWEKNLVSIAGNAGMSLGMKTFIYVSGVVFLWAISVNAFFAVNSYEYENSCIFGLNERFIVNWDMNPFSCQHKEIPVIYNPRTNSNIFWLNQRAQPMKPLILLYPEKVQEVQVELEYTPGFSATFPRYDNAKKGWSVTANPDGTLLDHTTKQETYWLFWEGNLTHANYNTSKGWVIQGWEVREFLYEKLTEIGLNTKEKSDFIMFWYPKLQDYPYLQITFTWDDYNQSAPLKITPKPDSLLRVFMVAKPLDVPIQIEPQKLERFERKGFSVVEWGGAVLE